MVAEYKTKKRLLWEVAEIYNWIDRQLGTNVNVVDQCNACGKCCDFGAFDHRLFVTVPELMYLAANLDAENLKPMPTSRCPYNIDGKCTVYDYRFAGCRIFCCKGDSDFQSSLSETVLKKLKKVCLEFEVPYRYADLACALNSHETV